jgi:hypothetical protein
LDADREGHGHGHGQALGDHSDELADPHHEDLTKRKAAEKPDRVDRDEQANGSHHDVASELGDAALERRLRLGRAGGKGGDVSDLRGEAGGHHHGSRTAGREMSARVEHVAPVSDERVPGEGRGVFVDGDRLPGQGRLRRLGGRTLENPCVRRYGVAGRDVEDVPGDDRDRLDDAFATAAQDPGGVMGQAPKRIEAFLRTAFLEGPDDRIRENDDDDDGGVGAVPQGQGQRRGDQEQIDQRAPELPQEAGQRRPTFGLGEGVRAETAQAPRRFILGEAAPVRQTDRRHRLVRAEHMPGESRRVLPGDVVLFRRSGIRGRESHIGSGPQETFRLPPASCAGSRVRVAACARLAARLASCRTRTLANPRPCVRWARRSGGMHHAHRNA